MNTSYDNSAREIALAQVKENGLALKNLQKNFRSDPEIVLNAIEQNAYAINNADKELGAVYNSHW